MNLTYHNDPAIKAKAIARCKEHIEADRLRAGNYGQEFDDGFRGCAIGCQLWDIAREEGWDWRDRGDEHEIVAEAYWPGQVWLSHLEDRIFECLPSQERKEWPLRLVSAVPVGVDITPVSHRLTAYILRDVLRNYFHGAQFPEVAAAVEGVARLHERASGGDVIFQNEWAQAQAWARSARWAAEARARPSQRATCLVGRAADAAASGAGKLWLVAVCSWVAEAAGEAAYAYAASRTLAAEWTAAADAYAASKALAEAADAASRAAKYSAEVEYAASMAREAAAMVAEYSAEVRYARSSSEASASAYKQIADKLIELLRECDDN